MVERIVKETGYPTSVVRHILDKQMDVMKDALVAQDEIHFPQLFKLRASARKVKYPTGKNLEVMEETERVVLYVRPMESLRQEMNRWTSTQS
jgi:nucleoid DNA-binding protein